MANPRAELNERIRQLDQISREKGVNTPEFFSLAKNFVIYVQIRYVGFVDEDLTQTINLRIVKSLEYYDGKTNIGTWVYSIARHQCSGHIYHRNKRLRESSEPLPYIETPGSLKPWRENEEDDMVRSFFESHQVLIITPTGDTLSRFRFPEVVDAVKRDFNWKNLISHLS